MNRFHLLVLDTREQQTPVALAAFHKAEIEKWVAHHQGNRHQDAVKRPCADCCGQGKNLAHRNTDGNDLQISRGLLRPVRRRNLQASVR
jgi:hypothetical protein